MDDKKEEISTLRSLGSWLVINIMVGRKSAEKTSSAANSSNFVSSKLRVIGRPSLLITVNGAHSGGCQVEVELVHISEI